MTVLDEIIVGVRQDLAKRQETRSLADLERAVAELPSPLDVMPALAAPGLSVIAEVKRASPSKGNLADIDDPAELARAYQAGGAAAISVLTEARRFRGSLSDLAKVRAAVQTPLLRKDFVVTDYQLWEGRAAGADLALLIVAALSEVELQRLLTLGRSLGLACLVETHTPDEVKRAVDAGADLIGVNNRNLKTLAVDLAQFERLVPLIPPGAVTVAESGILSLADAARMAQAGADAVLVGEALVKDGDPAAAIRAMRSLA
ncbi:MAG: indole-3-glycerol phosphate synthase TrpC [Propionicimonas sp.]